MSLRDKVVKMNKGSEGIPFMDGREKGKEIPVGCIVNVDNYGFIKGDNGDYVVLSLKEAPEHFFFGGQVVTEKFKQLDEELTVGDRKELEAEGVPIMLTWKKAKGKNGRDYMVVEFYPEEDLPFID